VSSKRSYLYWVNGSDSNKKAGVCFFWEGAQLHQISDCTKVRDNSQTNSKELPDPFPARDELLFQEAETGCKFNYIFKQTRAFHFQKKLFSELEFFGPDLAHIKPL